MDCVSLIDAIAQRGSIRLYFKPSQDLREEDYARTLYIPGLYRYLMLVNEKKLSHPFDSSIYQNLNSALALELAHIILKHSGLPDDCKDKLQRKLESLEAEDFADKLLTPKGKYVHENSVFLLLTDGAWKIYKWIVSNIGPSLFYRNIEFYKYLLWKCRVKILLCNFFLQITYFFQRA